MAEILDKLWFSQAALSAWLSCPLKFKYRYIDSLYWPLPAGTLQGLELGRKFHLLAQYYYIGHKPSVPAAEDPLLKQWLDNLERWLPRQQGVLYLPEYELRSNRDGLRLLAKYDLVAMGQERVLVYDWKTDHKPPKKTLKTSPQTRLYLYLLCSAPQQLPARPGNVEMTYWNPRYPQQPLTITYSSRQWEEDGRWLAEVTEEIKRTAAFPATTNEKNCSFCEYRPVCHGKGLEDSEQLELDLDEVNWDEIEEISLQGVNVP